VGCTSGTPHRGPPRPSVHQLLHPPGPNVRRSSTCARAQMRDILNGARALLVRPSTTLASCSLTDIQRRTRQTPDCRMTTTQLSGRSRVRGDAPGCMRACLPCRQRLPIALPPRVPHSASGKPGGDSIPRLRVPCSLHLRYTQDVTTLARPCESSGSLAIRVGIRGSCDGHVPL